MQTQSDLNSNTSNSTATSSSNQSMSKLKQGTANLNKDLTIMSNGYHHLAENSDAAVDVKDKNNNLSPQNVYTNDEEFKKQVLNQLEFYFSRENLLHDKYLVSQMDNDNYVPVSILASFNMIKKLFANHLDSAANSQENRIAFIIDLIKLNSSSTQLQLDHTQTKLRANHKRCVVILREIDKSTPVEDLFKLFDKCNVKCLNCEFAGNRSWYLSFKDEQDAQIAVQYLKEEVQTFNGEALFARIKTNPIPRVKQQPVQTTNDLATNDTSIEETNKSPKDSLANSNENSNNDTKQNTSTSSTNSQFSQAPSQSQANYTSHTNTYPPHTHYPPTAYAPYNTDAFKFYNYINTNQTNHANFYLNNGPHYPNYDHSNAANMALLANPWMMYTTYMNNSSGAYASGGTSLPASSPNFSQANKKQSTTSSSNSNTDNSSTSATTTPTTNNNNNNNNLSSSSSVSNLSSTTPTNTTSSTNTTNNPPPSYFGPTLINPLDPFMFPYSSYAPPPHAHFNTNPHYAKPNYIQRNYNYKNYKTDKAKTNYKKQDTPVSDIPNSSQEEPVANNTSEQETETESTNQTKTENDSTNNNNTQQTSNQNTNNSNQNSRPYRSYQNNNKYNKYQNYNNLSLYHAHANAQFLFPAQMPPGSFGLGGASIPYSLSHFSQFASPAKPAYNSSYNTNTTSNYQEQAYQEYYLNNNNQKNFNKASNPTKQSTETRNSSNGPKFVNGYAKKSFNPATASKSNTDINQAISSDNSSDNKNFSHEKRNNRPINGETLPGKKENLTNSTSAFRERNYAKPFDRNNKQSNTKINKETLINTNGVKEQSSQSSSSSFQKKTRYNKNTQELPSPKQKPDPVQFDYEPNSFPPLQENEQAVTAEAVPIPPNSSNEEELIQETNELNTPIEEPCNDSQTNCYSRRSFADIVKQRQKLALIELSSKLEEASLTINGIEEKLD